MSIRIYVRGTRLIEKNVPKTAAKAAIALGSEQARDRTHFLLMVANRKQGSDETLPCNVRAYKG